MATAKGHPGLLQSTLRCGFALDRIVRRRRLALRYLPRRLRGAPRELPRILETFARYGIKTTWDITGHSIESFPAEAEMVAKNGHEIGVHGYTHENPLAMSRQQEADVLDKCVELVTELCGVRPTGYVAPWWELSPNTIDLLTESAASSTKAASWRTTFRPTTLRKGDRWTKIDYSKDAS